MYRNTYEECKDSIFIDMDTLMPEEVLQDEDEALLDENEDTEDEEGKK